MARDRQRAKQRQAERRARRQAGAQDTPPATPGIEDPRASNPAPGITPDIAVGAPPEQEGRSDFTARDEPELDEERDAELEAEALAEVEDRELGVDTREEERAGDAAEADEPYAPRGRRGEAVGGGQAKDRSRVVQFLIASWAELQRVQWPDRQALTTLTGVVLGFVLIMGGYLGLLDAVFSRIVNAIL